MKLGTSRRLLAVLWVVAGCLSASAATRVCSVYVESFAALQKQIFLGAEAFQVPMLGILPMMITGGLPGAAQLDNTKPIAIHVFDFGDGETGMVIEVSPAGSPDAYLKALAGVADAGLPEPKNGVYTLGKGLAAKIAGGRLFFVRKAKRASACLADGLEQLSDLPTIPGVIRVAVEPAAVLPLLEQALAAMPKAKDQDAEQGQRARDGMTALYGQMLEQLDALYLGLDVQAEGLFLRTRLMPKAGTDMARLAASGKAASARQLAFIEKDSLFSFAAGGSVLPERMKRQLIDFYAGLVASTPLYAASQTNDLMAFLSESLAQIGAPTAVMVGLPAPDGAVQVQGAWGLADPAGYLDGQIAKMKAPFFQKMMAQSGLRISEPAPREINGLKAYAWKIECDEPALEKIVRTALPPNTPPEQADAAVVSSRETMRTVMKFCGGGYEYAATPQELLFGMGGDAAITAAVARVQSAKASAEAERIEALLSPSGDPHTLGRIALSRIMGLSSAAQPGWAEAAKGVPAGEGVVFAGWPVGGELLTALLVPASEIKSIAAMVMAGQARPARKQGKAPARPPIPDNF